MSFHYSVHYIVLKARSAHSHSEYVPRNIEILRAYCLSHANIITQLSAFISQVPTNTLLIHISCLTDASLLLAHICMLPWHFAAWADICFLLICFSSIYAALCRLYRFIFWALRRLLLHAAFHWDDTFKEISHLTAFAWAHFASYK